MRGILVAAVAAVLVVAGAVPAEAATPMELAGKLQAAGLGCENFKARDFKYWGGKAGRCDVLGEDISIETYGRGKLSQGAQMVCSMGVRGYGVTDGKSWVIWTLVKANAPKIQKVVGGQVKTVCQLAKG